MLQRSHVWKEIFKKEELLESHFFQFLKFMGNFLKKVSLFVILAQCLFWPKLFIDFCYYTSMLKRKNIFKVILQEIAITHKSMQA